MTPDAEGEAGDPQRTAPTSSSGAALRPATLMQDPATTVGYEVLRRPPGPAPELCHPWWHAALSLAVHTSPGLLLLPIPACLDVAGASELGSTARRSGAEREEVVWLIDEKEAAADPARARELAGALRRQRFRVAVDRVMLGSDTGAVIGDLRPEFALLDERCAPLVCGDEVLEARLASTIVLLSRLGGRAMARGVADRLQAHCYVGVGVQYAIGPLMGGPVVLDPASAAPGDEAVGPAWFRARGTRRYQARGDAFDARVIIRHGGHGVSPTEEADFAHTLSEAARVLQAERDPRRIAAVIVDLLERVVPGNRIALYEADHEARLIRPLVVGGVEAEEVAATPLPVDLGITGWAFQRGVPYNCPDVTRHPLAAQIPGARDMADESLIIIPLVAGDVRLGVLDIWREGRDQFSEYDLERAALFGYVAAAAWRNAQLYAELEERAMTDALTGMLNTRWLEQVAPREAAQAQRNGKSIGILLVDLDHFKQVNDTAGHAAGDAVLRAAARAIRSVVRVGDAAVRYGGDEFLLMLHDSDVRGAARVAAAANAALSTVRVPLPGTAPVTVTASIGVATFPEHGQALDDAVRAADAAMYRAKAAGRNRVEAAG